MVYIYVFFIIYSCLEVSKYNQSKSKAIYHEVHLGPFT